MTPKYEYVCENGSCEYLGSINPEISPRPIDFHADYYYCDQDQTDKDGHTGKFINVSCTLPDGTPRINAEDSSMESTYSGLIAKYLPEDIKALPFKEQFKWRLNNLNAPVLTPDE